MNVTLNALAAVSFSPSDLLVEATRPELTIMVDHQDGTLRTCSGPRGPEHTDSRPDRGTAPHIQTFRRAASVAAPRGHRGGARRGALRSTDGARRGPSVTGPSVVHDGSICLMKTFTYL